MRIPFQSLFETRGVRLPAGFDTVSSLLGREPTTAGVSVTEETAEGLPTVFACVRVIANAVAQLPLKLFQVQPDGSKREATDHPLYTVLHELANPEMTSYELRALLTSHVLLWGNAYAEIIRNARGEVSALWPLLPWAMRVDRDDARRLRFQYGDQRWLLDPARPALLRLSINSLDGVTGRSVVRVLREALGLGLALQRFGSSFFGNGTVFGGVLSSDMDLTEDQKSDVRTTIETLHKSPDKAHKMLVLGAGLKYQPFGMPLEDSQFLESRKFQRSEICGAYGVPPHMIADLDRATFSNVENESLRWLRDGAEPHLVNWESALHRDCLGPRARSTYYARFIRNAMVRGDLKSRSEALAIQRQNGVISPNEWRALEEMDPISESAGGNQYLTGPSK